MRKAYITRSDSHITFLFFNRFGFTLRLHGGKCSGLAVNPAPRGYLMDLGTAEVGLWFKRGA